MEPIRHTLTARFRSLKMYREELDQLVELFETACAKVTISDKKHRYLNLAEMKEHIGPKITDLDIQGEKPGLHFVLNQIEDVKGYSTPTRIMVNELRTEEINDEADALFRKVKDFLTEHQLPRFRMLFLVFGIIGIMAAAGIMLWSLAHPNQAPELKGKVSFSVLLGFLGCLAPGVIFSLMAGNIRNDLTLETKLSSPRFLVTNKNNILMLLIGTGIGIVGTLVAQFLSYLVSKWLSF